MCGLSGPAWETLNFQWCEQNKEGWGSGSHLPTADFTALRLLLLLLRHCISKTSYFLLILGGNYAKKCLGIFMCPVKIQVSLKISYYGRDVKCFLFYADRFCLFIFALVSASAALPSLHSSSSWEPQRERRSSRVQDLLPEAVGRWWEESLLHTRAVFAWRCAAGLAALGPPASAERSPTTGRPVATAPCCLAGEAAHASRVASGSA